MIATTLVTSTVAVGAFMVALLSLVYTIFQGTKTARMTGEAQLLTKIEDLKKDIRDLKEELRDTKRLLENETAKNIKLMQRLLKIENGDHKDA